MDFYDRINELESLDRIEKQSTETACFTIMLGRRRIGKTALLLRASEGRKMLYLFVSRNSEAVLCRQFQQQATEALGIQIYGSINRFADLFEQLLIFAQHEHYTLILDEFQDFEKINRSIFSEIQDLWDRYKDKIKLNLIACGSIYSLIMKFLSITKNCFLIV